MANQFTGWINDPYDNQNDEICKEVTGFRGLDDGM
jgi:hypothetical protein